MVTNNRFKQFLLSICGGLVLGMAFPVHTADGNPVRPALATVPTLNVPRYMGTWYEIARYPNRFQKKCVSAVRADYRLRPDARIEVINRCRLADGKEDQAIGEARQIGKPDSAKLEVRFAPAWLSFLPAVWGDYWIIDLDDRYQLAAVSDSEREYLWILSRTPGVATPRYEALLARLREQGFNTERLVPTPQP